MTNNAYVASVFDPHYRITAAFTSQGVFHIAGMALGGEDDGVAAASSADLEASVHATHDALSSVRQLRSRTGTDTGGGVVWEADMGGDSACSAHSAYDIVSTT